MNRQIGGQHAVAFSPSAGRRSTQQAYAELAARLRLRRREIEQALMARAYGVSEPPESAEPAYLDGLSAAVSAALEHSIGAIELGEGEAPPVPAVLLTQARLAARNGVRLDTVLRRYVAGYTLLSDFIIEEAETGVPLQVSALQLLSRASAAVFDRLIAAVSEVYSQEAAAQREGPEQRHSERIDRLLKGEPLDTSDIPYDLSLHHVGVVATGPAATEVIRQISAGLGCLLLLDRQDERTVRAWLGLRRVLDPAELESHVSDWPAGVSLAIGEPGKNLTGWRLTHRQARAALPIALRSRKRLVRYSDVALLATMLQDKLLATSLHELFLTPLERERDGGESARKTLRAYIAAGRNVTSAAAALGINRNTVSSRLQAIEERIGRPLASCGAELEAALRLDELSEYLY